jgi:CBS domain-containing protein
MSAPLVIVTPDTPLEECMALMTDRRIRHLPVLEHGEIAAVISIGDLVKYQSQAQSFELRYLHDYINAR